MSGMGNEDFYVSSYWWRADGSRIWNVWVGEQEAGSIILSDCLTTEDAFLLAGWCFLDNQDPDGNGAVLREDADVWAWLPSAEVLT